MKTSYEHVRVLLMFLERQCTYMSGSSVCHPFSHQTYFFSLTPTALQNLLENSVLFSKLKQCFLIGLHKIFHNQMLNQLPVSQS